VVCWLSDSDLVRARELGRSGAWRARLAESRYAGEGWLAVGDVASAFDPLASAGITLALRTAREAAEAIERHLEGETEALGEYAAAVRRRFAGYLIERREQYRAEPRWSGSAFWARRQGNPQ
jgi:flavin-dependent dehydrogenase